MFNTDSFKVVGDESGRDILLGAQPDDMNEFLTHFDEEIGSNLRQEAPEDVEREEESAEMEPQFSPARNAAEGGSEKGKSEEEESSSLSSWSGTVSGDAKERERSEEGRGVASSDSEAQSGRDEQSRNRSNDAVVLNVGDFANARRRDSNATVYRSEVSSQSDSDQEAQND